MTGPQDEKEMLIWLSGFRAGYCAALGAVENNPEETPEEIKQFWLKGWDDRLKMLKTGVTYNEIRDEIEAL